MTPFDYFPLTDDERKKLAGFMPPTADRGAFTQSEKDVRPYSNTAMLSDLPTHHYSGYNNSIQHNTPDNRASDRGSFASRVGSWISERLPVGPNGPVDRTMDDVRNRTIAQNNHAFGRQNAPEVQAYVDRTDPIRAKNQQPWATTRDNFLHSVESAVTAPARAATGELQPYAFDPATGDVRNDAMIGEAFNLAGVAAMGGGMAVKPQSAARALSKADTPPKRIGHQPISPVEPNGGFGGMPPDVADYIRDVRFGRHLDAAAQKEAAQLGEQHYGSLLPETTFDDWRKIRPELRTSDYIPNTIKAWPEMPQPNIVWEQRYVLDEINASMARNSEALAKDGLTAKDVQHNLFLRGKVNSPNVEPRQTIHNQMGERHAGRPANDSHTSEFLPGVKLYSNADSKSGLAGVAAGKAKAQDRSLGLDPQGRGNEASRVLAETPNSTTYAKARQAADDAFAGDIAKNSHRYFDDFEYDPKTGNTIGSASLDDALSRGLDGAHSEFGYATASALEAAARATGRDLFMSPGGYGGSFYGDLKTPSGNSYKVRSSNHARISGHHDAPDFNIAPGEMTPDEFIRKLPTIFSNGHPLPGVAGISSAPQQELTDEEAAMILKRFLKH